MAGKKGRSGTDSSTTTPKPGSSKEKRLSGRGAKPGPKQDSRNKPRGS